MNRTPPLMVQRILRREVGFGCPIPNCRKPFLTFHHFDPPWCVEHHHNPEGMIALCTEHHPMADGGNYSKDELRALKQSTCSVEEVKATFPWSKREMLLRLGGCYTAGHFQVLSVSGEPIIALGRAPNGLLLVSFCLRSKDGRTSVVMLENMLQGDPESFYDLEVNTVATNVTVRFAKGNIGLDLSFSRLTLEELDRVLSEDRERSAAKMLREWDTLPFHLPEDIRQSLPNPDPSDDRIATKVKEWATANCLDDEQKVPLLDFKTLVVHGCKRRLKIRNGIEEGEGGMFYCASFDNKGSAFNL